MNDMAFDLPALDDIGDLIDDAIRNPDRADAIKARIRRRLRGEPIPTLVSAPPADVADDTEDMWDNVPV